MTRSETINELAGALALAQAEIAHAKKESENPHFRHRYADLASIWDACRAALTKRGLSIVQSPRLISGGELWLVEVETTLFHASGQYLGDILAVPVNPASAQAVGSAITYARRYALAAFVGVAPEDEDASPPPPERFKRDRDLAAERAPEPPPPIETARVQVLGIIQRAKPGGGSRFIVTGDDQQTYATDRGTLALEAKAAKEASRALAIEYRTTAAGREIVRLRDAEAPPV